MVIAPGEKIMSVVPNAEIHWNNAAEIDEITTPSNGILQCGAEL